MTPIVACPLCEGRDLARVGSVEDIERIASEPFELLACRACGAVMTSPVPEGDEVAAYYPPSFYGAFDSGTGAILSAFLWRRTVRLMRHLSPPARVLDFGCGDGRFMAALAGRGFEVIGVEPSSAGSSAAAQAARGDVLPSLDGVADASVDAVTSWQVLEHVTRPRDVLKQIRRVVRPGGIVLVSVPNFGSVEARLFKGRWFHLDVPRHVVHFTPASLGALLRSEGLEPLESSTRCFEYNVFGLMQSALNCLPVERNALYRVVKRREPLTRLRPATRASVIGALVGLPLLAGAAVLGCFAEETLGRGATITVVARRV